MTISSISDDPYAPPTTVIADVSPTLVPAAALPFFPVSVTKLIVMCLCTLGLYELHWFYENWKRVNLRRSRKVIPLARTTFAFVYCYPCFRMVRNFPRPSGTVTRLAAGPLAIGWVLATLLLWVQDVLSLIGLLNFVFFIPVQVQINRIHAEVAPEHETNSRITVLNWVAIVVGGGLLLLMLLGALVLLLES